MMTRFTAGVVLVAWAGCVAYPLGLLLAATPADFASLRTAFLHIPYLDLVWYPQPVTLLQVQRLCLLLALATAGLAGSGLALLRANWAQRYQLRHEWAIARRRVWQALRRLSGRQRRLLVVGLLALFALRAFIGYWLAPEDDIGSYQMFVRHSLLLIGSCYPLPNNHVLTNSISRLFYLVHPGFWWSMRLPGLLLGTVGLLSWYALVVLRTNFRVASFAVGLFSCLEVNLFNSLSGRAYWLILALSGLGFDGVLTLTAPAKGRNRQLPWLALAVMGPLGLYAVPTFAFFLFSAYTWLGGYWLARTAWRPLLQLGLLASGTVLTAGLLYAPVWLVSGSAALLHNPYVEPAADWAAYLRSLPGELWTIEGRLTVEKHVGWTLTLGVLVGSGYLAWQTWRRAGWRAVFAPRLSLLAVWCVLSPYLLMIAQRVRAPERTLMYKSQYFFLLLMLLLERVRAQPWRPRWYRRRSWVVLLSGWLLVQFILLYRHHQMISSYGKPPITGATSLLHLLLPTYQ